VARRAAARCGSSDPESLEVQGIVPFAPHADAARCAQYCRVLLAIEGAFAMSASVPVRRSRRAVLGAALGATAATVATAVHAPHVLGAGSDGSTVVIGGSYPAAQSQTKIVNTSAVQGDNEFNRVMWLESQLGLGLYAKGEQGVFGMGNQYGLGAWAPNATIGHVLSAAAKGVYGFAPGAAPACAPCA
jgi:hypothetical protein